MRLFYMLFMLAFLTTGCNEKKPDGILSFTNLYKAPTAYVFEFESNVNFEELYEANKYRKIVVKKLVCALGGDHNFDLEHTMQYVFRGDLQIINAAEIGKKNAYKYASHGGFYETIDSGAELKLLSCEALKTILVDQKSVPCSVVMTVYLSSPYYSSVMLVPVENILRASSSSIRQNN